MDPNLLFRELQSKAKFPDADFAKWKVVFDEMKKSRLEHGFIGHEPFRDETDPNTVVIVNRVKNLENALAYGHSPALKEAMLHAGVISAPEITFLRDEEMESY